MDCMCILFGLEPSWHNAHAKLLRNVYTFHEKLKAFDRNVLSAERRALFVECVDKMLDSGVAIEKVWIDGCFVYGRDQGLCINGPMLLLY